MAKTLSRGFCPSVGLDREVARPIHSQLTAALRDAIDRGLLARGTRLASTRALATEWGVSRNTVLQVFAALTAEGYVVSRVGDGTYVADTPAPAAPGPDAAPDPVPAYPFRGLSRRGRTLTGDGVAGVPDRPVPFMPNVPDFREFPIRSWLRLMNETSGRMTGEALAGVSSAGYQPLRVAIARHVSVTRGQKCLPEQVIVTTGSQQGHDLVVRLLVDRGDPVWMEEPGYTGIRSVFAANGCNVQSVPVDGDGLDVAFAASHALTPRLICVTPARQFPTGAVLSADRRAALLRFAAQSGAWIVEDDFDSDYHYAAPAPPSLAAQDSGNSVIVVGTFSTTLVPSLRLGYLIVPPDLIPAFAAARSVYQGHASFLEQMVLAEMMNRGIYAAHVRRMRVLYRERLEALCAGLADRFGYAVPEQHQAAGLHVLLPFADPVDDRTVVAALGRAGLVTRGLSGHFALSGGAHGLLLGFAPYAIPQIHAGIDSLGAELAALGVDVCRQEARAPLP